MHLARHLTFANVASATALVVALGGGGVAVAAGLEKNSVGSPQIKNGAIKTEDLGGNAVTGAKVKESSLGTVPSAASAESVDSVVTKRVTAASGETKVLATRGSLKVQLTCYAGENEGEVSAGLEIVTTADNAAMDANLEGDEFSDFDVSTGAAEIVTSEMTTMPDIEDGGFAAVTPTGVSWKGYGFAFSHLGSADCAAEVTFLG